MGQRIFVVINYVARPGSAECTLVLGLAILLLAILLRLLGLFLVGGLLVDRSVALQGGIVNTLAQLRVILRPLVPI